MYRALDLFCLLLIGTQKYGFRLSRILVAVIASLAAAASWAADPTVTWTGPGSNGTYVAPATIVFSGRATPGSGTITRVTVAWGDTWRDGNVGADGNFSIPVTQLPEGSYQFVLIAFDSGGGRTESTPLSLVVNPHVPPVVSWISPANGSTYAAPASITFKGAGLVGSSPISRVTVAWADTWSDASQDAAGNYVTTVNNLAAGHYLFYLIGYDTDGGRMQSDPIEVTVAPHVPPIVTWIGPPSNSTYVAPATIPFRGSATAAPGSSPVNRTTVAWGSSFQDANADANGNFAANIGGFQTGSYQFYMIAWDNGGGRTQIGPFTINVYSNPAPTVSIAQVPRRIYAPGTTIPLQASAADDGSVAQVEFFAGDTSLGLATLSSGSASSGTWVSNAWANVAAGTYSVTAKATDDTGGVSYSDPVTILVSANLSASVAAAASGYTAPASVPLTATAGSATGSIDSVQFFAGGTPIGQGYLASGTASSGTYITNAWTNVAAGTYSITAVATDTAGYSIASAPVSYTVGAASSGANTAMYFVTTDHLGTPRLIEDQMQQAVWRWDQQEPFGDSVPNDHPGSGGVFVFNLRFGGVTYYDAETGTLQNTYRDLDPQSGRYVQSDPIGLEGGIDTYAYVGGDPLGYYDRYGLWEWGDPLPQEWVDAAAGFGDNLSLDLTRGIRKTAGWDNTVNTCSRAYVRGEWAAIGLSLTFGGAHLGRAALNQVGKRGSIQLGLKRLFAEDRGWSAVQKMWSRSVGGYKGEYELHHWFTPRSFAGSNAGWNYVPVTPWLNSFMGNGGWVYNTFKASIIGIYGAVPTAIFNTFIDNQ